MVDNPDIDPNWYPGQPEIGVDTNVPTVMTKLQKWGDYAAFGEPVAPTMFIPMKTPLSETIMENWSLQEKPKHSLTISELLTFQESRGRKVGMLLDLSNHECLYTDDIPESLEYKHISLIAKELPPEEFVAEVTIAANAFWRKHPDQYIAVHCAYGFNRTGFVLCSYLIENWGFTVEAALDAFGRARPPGVKHEKFRQELFRRYGRSSACRAVFDIPCATCSQDSLTNSSLVRSPPPSEEQKISLPTFDYDENESLGANDRVILAGLRQLNKQLNDGTLEQSEVEACITDTKKLRDLGRHGPSVKRLSEIEWCADDEGPKTL